MRIILVTISTLIASAMAFGIVKFWGYSQVYFPYQNTLLNKSALTTAPSDTINLHPLSLNKDLKSQILIGDIFFSPKIKNLTSFLQKYKNHVYLNVTNTKDQVVIVTDTISEITDKNFKDIRLKNFDQVKDFTIPLNSLRTYLKNRRIILNLIENPIAGHEILVDELKKMDLLNSDSVIITSPYDVMTKSIKELAPTLIFGSTAPENLRIKALESVSLIEASTFRADIIIHPITYYKRLFYSNELINELNRRHKKWIVGPMDENTFKQNSSLLQKLNSLGVIIQLAPF